MSSAKEEARIVDNLAIIQKGKLRTNAGKPYWRNNPNEGRLATLERFLDLLWGEVEELKHVVRSGTSPQVRGECADIANYAAMICDLAGDDSPDREQEA